MVRERDGAERDEEVFADQTLLGRVEVKFGSFARGFERGKDVTAWWAGELGATASTLANGRSCSSFSSSRPPSPPPFIRTSPFVCSSPSWEGSASLGSPRKTSCSISRSKARRSFLSRMMWTRAVLTPATSMSALGNPSGSTSGVSIVQLFCLWGRRSGWSAVEVERRECGHTHDLRI